MRKEIQLSYDDWDKDDKEITYKMVVPAKNALCDCCGGDGKVENPAFSNGFSQEELDEDPDFKEAYFEGRYDVTCPECRGAKIVLVPDVSAMTFAQKRFMVLHRRDAEERAAGAREMAAWSAAERAFGA